MFSIEYLGGILNFNVLYSIFKFILFVGVNIDDIFVFFFGFRWCVEIEIVVMDVIFNDVSNGDLDDGDYVENIEFVKNYL